MQYSSSARCRCLLSVRESTASSPKAARVLTRTWNSCSRRRRRRSSASPIYALTRQRFIGRAHSRRRLNRFEFANVICGKVPVFGALDDKPFVFVTGQRRIELRMATIKRDKERPFRITLRPHIMILTGVPVLTVRSFRSKTFVLVEVFQFSLR